MNFDSCCHMQMIGSEFGITSMKEICPALYQQFTLLLFSLETLASSIVCWFTHLLNIQKTPILIQVYFGAALGMASDVKIR